MESFSLLLDGFSVALTPMNIGLVFAGALLGTVIGMLPGIGPVNAIAILFPITLTLGVGPESALILFAGIFYGAQYGNSISSILLNVPGTSASAVTALDGYQMAKNGRAGPALAMSAIASFIGGTLSILFLILFAPLLASFAIDFGPAEYFVLMILALTALTSFADGSPFKALISASLGLMLATIGTDAQSGTERFTFNEPELIEGIDFIVVVIGFFAISELLDLLYKEVKESDTAMAPINRVMITMAEFKGSIKSILRSCGSGFLVGVLPGAGATIASFMAYATEKRIVDKEETFGKGDIRGVAAPESANNSSAVGSFIPLLILGVPGSETTAVMLAGLISLGIQPGPTLLIDAPSVFWGLAASMFIGNLVLILLNLPLVGLFAKILTIPRWVLMPLIAMFSIVGVYSISGNGFDLIMMAVFGVIGFIMRRTGFPLAPVILGLVLGVMIETNFRRALIYGDYTIFFESGITQILWVLAFSSLFLPPLIRKLRKKA